MATRRYLTKANGWAAILDPGRKSQILLKLRLDNAFWDGHFPGNCNGHRMQVVARPLDRYSTCFRRRRYPSPRVNFHRLISLEIPEKTRKNQARRMARHWTNELKHLQCHVDARTLAKRRLEYSAATCSDGRHRFSPIIRTISTEINNFSISAQ